MVGERAVLGMLRREHARRAYERAGSKEIRRRRDAVRALGRRWDGAGAPFSWTPPPSWSYGSWGPPAVDAAHLRWNLALAFGPEAADALLPLLDPSAHHPYWDTVDLLDLVGAPEIELAPAHRSRLEVYLQSLLRRL